MNLQANPFYVRLIILLTGSFLHTIHPDNSPAQTGSKGWTPELSMQYRKIMATEMSFEGKHVAYVVREAVMDSTTSEFRQHIRVVSADGTSDVRYTRGKHSNFDPRWSPDGKRLAFRSTRRGKPQVFVIRLRGGEAWPITDAQAGVSRFRWGPEGKRIAFLMKNPKSEAEKRREKEKRDVNLVDREYRYNHLYITQVKPAGDTTRQVEKLTEGSFHVTGLDWSPDGKTIAFAHQSTPREKLGIDQDISMVQVDKGHITPLVVQPGYDGRPLFSGDGKTIAFTSSGGTPIYYTLRDLYTIPAGGGEPVRLAHTPDRRARVIGWTPNNEGLLVWETTNTSAHIFQVPVNGSPVRQISKGQGIYGHFIKPSYTPATDQLAFAYQNSATPQEVYISRRTDFGRQKLTTVNTNVPTPPMGKTQRITWKAPDNREIEGLLTRPVGYEPGHRVPLVVDVHGGPPFAHLRHFTGSVGRRFMIQVFAQNGYAVFRPNPRGSAGYGKAFREAAVANWGPGPFRDIMTGVDKTLEMGIAHPDSLAIMGASYGGYMAAYAVTQTNRFRAASMISGVSNMISMVGTSDIPEALVSYMDGTFREKHQIYYKNSPVYHVNQATTPTQILHGSEDKRVPLSQGKEFYRALKRKGIPTEMVVYPGMPHVPGEPKLLRDLTPRVADWFDQHLGR